MTPGGELHVATPTEVEAVADPGDRVLGRGRAGLSGSRRPAGPCSTRRRSGSGSRARGRGRCPAYRRVDATTNVFTLNAAAAERRLQAQPWIADATSPRAPHDGRYRHPGARGGRGDRVAGVPRLVAEDGSLLDVAGGLTVLPRSSRRMRRPWGCRSSRRQERRVPSRPWSRPCRSQVETGHRSCLTANCRWICDRGRDRLWPSEESAAKADALGAVLRWAAGQGRRLLSADVRVPAAPHRADSAEGRAASPAVIGECNEAPEATLDGPAAFLVGFASLVEVDITIKLNVTVKVSGSMKSVSAGSERANGSAFGGQR